MKTGVLRVLGVWVLLVAMVFALVKIDTASEWAVWWIPLMVLGVALVFAGKIAGKIRRRRDSGSI